MNELKHNVVTVATSEQI